MIGTNVSVFSTTCVVIARGLRKLELYFVAVQR